MKQAVFFRDTSPPQKKSVKSPFGKFYEENPGILDNIPKSSRKPEKFNVLGIVDVTIS